MGYYTRFGVITVLLVVLLAETRVSGWTPCSVTCGGGRQQRRTCTDRWFIFNIFGPKCKDVSQSCNEFCYNGFYSGGCRCYAGASGFCCENCGSIDHCSSGQQECTSSGTRCTSCQTGYFSGGWNNGCQDIQECASSPCQNGGSCSEPMLNAYRCTCRPGFTGTNCERRMCSGNNHYCWPGSCHDDLAQNCICASGFYPVINTGETTCQLQKSNTPSIDTCDFTVIGPNGEKKQATQMGASSACQLKGDVFGNFQPTSVEYDYLASFVPNTTAFPKPGFIVESIFGVTDASLLAQHIDSSGYVQSIHHEVILEDAGGDGKNATSEVSKKSNMNIANSHLSNGEMLCVNYEAEAGGYLSPFNVTSNQTLDAVAYRKTTNSKTICYKFDDAPPEHCKLTGTCDIEPIYIEQRVVRTPIVTIVFDGWFDPAPVDGTDEQASGIQQYDVTVNEVSGTKTELKVNNAVFTNTTVNENISSVTLNLTSNRPVLYCITLAVKDIADNLMISRRFVLYDNTSYIVSQKDNLFYVSSGAGYLWQTHHNDICLDWQNYFLNKYYFDNPLLSPIEPSDLINSNSVYEQTTGELPVSGTPNVDGIVSYKFSWSLNGGILSKEETVPNFLNQTICKNLNITDGETYTLQIRAVDIVNNTYAENRTIRIDSSVPHINRVWLTKDGYRQLYVHDSKDLTQMKLEFEALDPHSGVREVHWTFGVGDGEGDLGNGALSINTVGQTCNSTSTNCYCPDSGKCEIYNYSIDLNKLANNNKSHGNHNRNYYFTITVTNHAWLSKTEHVDILVDDSPPEPGVVYEGPAGSADIDYTSDTTIIAHWHGFIDHESGIKIYRVGLSNRCLETQELYNARNDTNNATIITREVPATETTLTLPANFTGQRYVTVVALNNAMAPSIAVCSDGITRDLSKPEIRNITIQHGRWSETIGCHSGRAWLLTTELQKVMLHNTSSCRAICKRIVEDMTEILIVPTIIQSDEDQDISDFMCKNLPLYTRNKIIYIPNDHINIQWDIEEGPSQVQDVYVGFGTDPSETASPSLVDYVSTNQKYFFRRQHEGLGTDDLFYIFIQAVNKAGLNTVLTVGPVLIDQTPPLVKYMPYVTLTQTDVVIAWENDTFYDLEQTEQINHVLMQIDHGTEHASPLLEWRLDHSQKCPDFTGGCFKFPIRRLQRQDTSIGLDFHVVLYAHNNAGHHTRVTTPTFRIPSRYPPSHAIILDTDPTDKEMLHDANVHFTPHTLCAKWTDLKHHKNLILEVGIGTSSQHDDTIAYHIINNTNNHCISNINIESGRKYFFNIRAACTGGHTISNSNGVTIYDESEIMNSLVVNMGVTEFQTTINPNKNATNTTVSFIVHGHLTIGQRYCVIVTTMNGATDDVQLHSSDAILDNVTHTLSRCMLYMRPLVHTPELYISSNINISTDYRITLVQCPNTIAYQVTNNLHSHWFINTSETSLITFEAAGVISHCKEDNENCTELISPFTKTDTDSTTTITGLVLRPGVIYKTAIRPCNTIRCLRHVLSEGVMIDNIPPSGDISLAEMEPATKHTHCHNVKILWHAFVGESGIVLYQWSISAENDGSRQLTQWQNILPQNTNNSKIFQVTECMVIPVHPHRPLFTCLRAYNGAGKEHTTCKRLIIPNVNAYDKHTVYDIDTVSPKWSLIKQILHSAVLGDRLSVLHDSEFNFGAQTTTVAGVILHANERQVTWYLMASAYLPTSCNTDDNCIMSTSSSAGYVEFVRSNVPQNTICYICAYSNATHIERELFTEKQFEIKACSNGFIIDTISPIGGYIHITNTEGYITDTGVIGVNWGGFSDNVDATILGYGSRINKYSLHIGSTPGRDDLMSRTAFNGGASSVLIRNSSFSDGTHVFVTVTAFDYAGNNITVTSQELMVDTSPPTEGSIRVNSDLGTGRYVGTESVNIHLTVFHDTESGIRDFHVGLGSRPDIMDVMAAKVYTTDHLELKLDRTHMRDGHINYINAVATNRAGLSSKIISTSIIWDTSPPAGGHVIDGQNHAVTDVDYQTDTSHIRGSWQGFSDPHSGILYYRAGLGSKPFRDDVQPFVDIGLSTEIVWNSTFIPGVRYYITVEACNWAGLCTTRSSDGIVLDNSPPVPGQVRVASGTNHQKYVPHSKSVHVEWFGFEDPQSGLEHFDVCLGTGPLQCDIQPWFNCLLASSTIKTSLSLPTNTDLYATVMSTNKAGLYVTHTSDSFRVDDSPPVSTRQPAFITDYNLVPGFPAQWEKSILRISWKFDDTESPIVRHLITLLTHHEGHTPIEHIEIGAENKLTINLDSKQWLHIGDKYRVSVTACNSAGLCATDVSNDLLIDSTPPHLGGLKHPMTWYRWKRDPGTTVSTVSISWYGFHDQESGIYRYYITISRTYSGQELSNGTISVVANETTDINIGIFNLTEAILPDDEIVISIWAENNAGMKSSTARVTVDALSTTATRDEGILELQKHSCDVHYCNKDCTCAVVGRPCVDVKVNTTCSELNSSDVSKPGLRTVNVYGGMVDEPQNITASSACLTGYWILSNTTNADVHRYEWSMGISGEDTGYGIFDLSREIPWNDVGLRTDIIHCLPTGSEMTHNTQYVVYVRAWYGPDQYAIFQSAPILVDQTAPSIRRGGFVKDSDPSCKMDYDYIDWDDRITGCWDRVFLESQSEIMYYTVAIGTSSNSDDVYPLTNVGLQTSYTVSNISLSHGTRYYFTVTAYNSVGLHTSVSSDGFVVDTDNPLAGIVFTTTKHRDVTVQLSTTSIGLSWNGFVDHYSGIRSYHAAVVMAGDIHMQNNNYTFRNVGLQNKVTFTNLNLEHGFTYHGIVYAVDAAGHVSNVSVSRGVLIDVTPPVGFACRNFSTVTEHIYTNTTTDIVKVTMTQAFSKDRLYKLSGEIKSKDTEGQVRFELNRFALMLPTAVNHDGTLVFEYSFLSPVSGTHDVELEVGSSTHITLSAALVQCDVIELDSSSAVQIQQISDNRVAVNVQVLDKESSLYKVHVGAGTTRSGFQVRALTPFRGGNNGVISADVPHGSPVYVMVIAENYAGLRSTFYGGPIIMDHTPPDIAVLDVHVDTVVPSSLVAAWTTTDIESGIKRCWCKLVGLTSNDVGDYQTASNVTSCVIPLSDVYHGQRLSVAVTCVNAVQLPTTATSVPIVVSSQKPTADNAHVEFVPTDISSPGKFGDLLITPSQANSSCVHLAWAGFSDPSGLHHYEYRLLKDNDTAVDWTSTSLRTQLLIPMFNIPDGSTVTGHVRAVNHGGYHSDIIQTWIRIDGSEPKLSGDPMEIVTKGNTIRLDWHGVFIANTDMRYWYSLYVGSQSGYSDLADTAFTTTETYEVSIPEYSILTPAMTEIHVVVTCTYSTGLHAIYTQRVTV